VKVLDKDTNGAFVVIDEVELEDWGVAACPSRNTRKAKAKVANAGK
jgi:phenylpyruvate tautomerase PptA (4-oxalocrotonate tautomerase family)